MKITYLIIIGIFSFGVKLLSEKNKKKAAKIAEKMQSRIDIAKSIETIKESQHSKHEIASLLIKLLEDYHLHENIGKKLTDVQIERLEKQIKLTLPLSYKLFLKYFGNGGTWIYTDSIDTVYNFSWLSDYRNHLGWTIELVGEKRIKVNSLPCLMSEDSNGGAWCWLTSEEDKDGEWPLAYYSDKKLHYKVKNFTEWLKILVASQGEVIRELDIDDKLGLG